MKAQVDPPTPRVDPVNAMFFEGVAAGVLLLQRCIPANHVIFYPRVLCPRCWSGNLEWFKASGVGTVFSYTFVHRAQHPAFDAAVPLALVAVELAEGPIMIARLRLRPSDTVHIGMSVGMVTPNKGEGAGSPIFRPI